MKTKIIAYYLPQYHPTEHNNMWWGEGFTEWTNVGKARPLFKGHYQPKVPADLGYYDLRLPETRTQQAELAKKAGIEGFCYYHYWFENGNEELDYPFKQVVKLGEPNFPFCLCWANESWNAKFWNIDGTVSKKLLAEQKYNGIEDNKAHFFALLNAFKDKRYIKINNKLVFVIYRPLQFPNISEFIKQWQVLALKNGFSGFHFIGYSLDPHEIDTILSQGFDAVNICRLNNFAMCNKPKLIKRIMVLFHKLFGRPYANDYRKIYHYLVGDEAKKENVYPTIVPNWDHTPRSGKAGYLYTNSTPEYFEKHLVEVKELIDEKHEKILFLKSWNEWGEGNYVEPDLKFGHGYLNAIKKVFFQ